MSNNTKTSGFGKFINNIIRLISAPFRWLGIKINQFFSWVFHGGKKTQKDGSANLNTAEASKDSSTSGKKTAAVIEPKIIPPPQGVVPAPVVPPAQVIPSAPIVLVKQEKLDSTKLIPLQEEAQKTRRNVSDQEFICRSCIIFGAQDERDIVRSIERADEAIAADKLLQQVYTESANELGAARLR